MTERTVESEQFQATFAPFQLEDVRLYEVRVERLPPGTEIPDELELKILLRPSDPDEYPEQFGQLLTFETTLVTGDEALCHIYMAIEGQFVGIVDIDTIKPDYIERFRESNTILLLWPYLREMLHDITGRLRLGMPPLPIVDARALARLGEIEEEEDPDLPF